MNHLINKNKLILTAICTCLLLLSSYADSDPIHDAAKAGNLEELKRLIYARVDVNAKTEDGWTALMFVAGNGHIEAVRVLLDAGANTDAQTNAKKYTPLMFATLNGHAQVVRMLIEAGADVNARAQDEWGHTALMLASEELHMEVVKLLVEARADVNARDTNGYTALFKASQKGAADVVNLLLNAGADVNAKGNTGETALMVASQYGHPEVARLLIEAQADVDAHTDGGVTALMFASYHGSAEVVRLLMEQAAEVDARTLQGYTAILFAAQRGQTEVVGLLEKARAPYVKKEAEQIPRGVTYIKATDKKNKSAKDNLLEIFRNAESNKILPKSVACGPFLWQELTEIMGFEKSAGIPMKFMLQKESGAQELEGRVIRWEDQTRMLQLALKTVLQKSDRFNIRKLSENEIQFYWYIISWDITEPVFIIESPGFLLLVDFEKEEVFFIENLYRPLRN